MKEWHIAHLTSIFQGSKIDPADYRPVNLKVSQAKWMGLVLREAVTEHMKMQNYLVVSNLDSSQVGQQCSS